VILVATLHDTPPVYGEFALAVGVCSALSSHVISAQIRLRSFEMFVFNLDGNSRDIAPANPNQQRSGFWPRGMLIQDLDLGMC
jgi:hypothetical protein